MRKKINFSTKIVKNLSVALNNKEVTGIDSLFPIISSLCPSTA